MEGETPSAGVRAVRCWLSVAHGRVGAILPRENHPPTHQPPELEQFVRGSWMMGGGVLVSFCHPPPPPLLEVGATAVAGHHHRRGGGGVIVLLYQMARTSLPRSTGPRLVPLSQIVLLPDEEDAPRQDHTRRHHRSE